MAYQVFVLDEVIGMLKTISAPNRVIEDFRKQAAFVAEKKNVKTYDNVEVASGFGAKTKRGFVDLTINDQRSQMDVKKAREIGLMLIECAEAAMSDEMVMTLLDRIGKLDDTATQRILLELREIRQGSRTTVYPQ